MEQKNGTYAGLKFSHLAANELVEYCRYFDVPNALPKEKFHVTLLYSRKHLPDFKPQHHLETPIICYPKELVVWETSNIPKTRCLIMKLESPALVERHKMLMAAHGATYDYPEYSPHVTLSYDIGDLDISTLALNRTFELPLVFEYHEDLKLDWAANHQGKQ